MPTLKSFPLVLFYNFFIRLYLLGIRVASLWNGKAGEWISGRKELFTALQQKIGPSDRIIWFHCASAGELEQAKPLIEELKLTHPVHKILVSFFSPSGFQVAKKYQFADIITYLPADTAANARRFVSIVNPELVIFIKYEFWYHHLSTLAFRHVPVLLVSSIFRKQQTFFKWYGGLHRRMLFLFRGIFVQDEASLALLESLNVEHGFVAGDTRFDRVYKIAEQFRELPLIDQFVRDGVTLVAGSTWPDDEKLLAAYTEKKKIRLIIAPHEINEQHVLEIEKLFRSSIRYSQLENKEISDARVLIIDNMGMLSRLYRYATISYVGGGFNKSGIHNTLEAAVHGKAIFFGPFYRKFREARQLIEKGGAFSISREEELQKKMDHLLDNPEILEHAGQTARNYVLENRGATEKILYFIQEKRLFTS